MFALTPEEAAVWDNIVQKIDGLKSSLINKNDTVTDNNLAKGIFLVGLDVILKTASLETGLNRNSDGELLN
jgi:hypothetical protein